jgi:hypothetical protein
MATVAPRAQSGEVTGALGAPFVKRAATPPGAVRRRLRDKPMNREHDPIESDRIML